ncbi:MAG: hypothetical protein ACHREM_16955 [Polyangiales bacterium]
MHDNGLLGTIIVSFVVPLAACSGGDASKSNPEGASGQACNPNGTCDAGLTCTAGTCAVNDGRPSDVSASDVASADSTGGTADNMPCTRASSTCDPSCGESCGTDPGCVDICCSTSETSGIWCKNVCIADACHLKACAAHASKSWSCVLSSDGTCRCSSASQTGTPVATCAVGTRNTQCHYSNLADWCECSNYPDVGYATFEPEVTSCTVRPGCMCATGASACP